MLQRGRLREHGTHQFLCYDLCHGRDWNWKKRLFSLILYSHQGCTKSGFWKTKLIKISFYNIKWFSKRECAELRVLLTHVSFVLYLRTYMPYVSLYFRWLHGLSLRVLERKCFCVLFVCMPSYFTCLLAVVPLYLTCLRAYVPLSFICLRA